MTPVYRVLMRKNHMNNGELQAGISIYDIDDFKNYVELKYLEKYDSFSDTFSVKVSMGNKEIFDLLYQVLYDNSVPGSAEAEFNFFGSSFYILKGSILVKAYYDTFYDRYGMERGANGKYTFMFHDVDYNRLSKMVNTVKEKLEGKKTHSVVWSFLGQSGSINTKEIHIPKQPKLHKEYYPWLDSESVEDYFDRYLESPDTILLLTGVPGTGKTTFIRSLITERKLNADITYDEKLIRSDEFFLRFINEDNKDILIIEDADTLLYDREQDADSVLNKILNISDGLVKNIGKKIVFSTNITDMEKIDSALIRPGRCYDVLDFRKLTYEESLAAAKKAGIDKQLDNRSHTLAEIFSTSNRAQSFKNKKMGF